jgi:hypothetical protein
MAMELKENAGDASSPSLLSEIFALTTGDGNKDASAQARALQQLHARLSSSEFIAQMTGVFFEAKRAALGESK